MSSTAQELFHRHRLTVHDYHRMGEAGILDEDMRVELIEGELIDMAPIGSLHAGTVTRLTRIFERAVGDAAIVYVQNPVMLGTHSEPQPDITLLKPRADFYTTSHPGPSDVLLIVEVSETTLRYDREVKIPLYGQHGIPEVWLIDLTNRGLQRFRTPAEQGYRDVSTLKQLGVLALACLPGIEVEFSGLL